MYHYMSELPELLSNYVISFTNRQILISLPDYIYLMSASLLTLNHKTTIPKQHTNTNIKTDLHSTQ